MNNLLLFIFFCLSIIQLNAQTIVGPTQVYAGEIVRYTFSGSNNTYFPDGWESDGEFLLDERGVRLSYMDVRWDSPGNHYIDINYTYINENGYEDIDYVSFDVQVLYVEAPVPPAPIEHSNEGGTVTLAWASGKAPQEDVNWYWQSNINDTSTANSNNTISVTTNGTYYLRAKNMVTGTWSNTTSEGISFTIAPPPLWYNDFDGDGFGDAAPYKESYTRPSGYVDNNLDQCPSEAGIYDGCPTKNDENYILSVTYQQPYTESSLTNSVSGSDKIENIAYFDGLGRPLQNVEIRAGSNSEDIITHIAYDDYGRQVKEYLSYASQASGGRYRSDALMATTNFYNTPKYENTTNPYSERRLEASPLGRVMEQGAPGEAWKVGVSNNNDHTIKFEYLTNSSSTVNKYDVSLTHSVSNGIDIYQPSLSLNGTYSAKELFKTVIKDENWTSGYDHTTEEYKDKQGRIILKRTYNNGIGHDTYYVYDDYGNLTYVLPPKSEPGLAKPNATELAELCHQYKFDEFNRLIEKKLPGKGWEYIVYNQQDLPILTQDANQRKENSGKVKDEWLFTKYDAFGRVAYTGLVQSDSDRTYLQAQAEGVAKSWVTQQGTAISLGGMTSLYYNNGGLPTTDITEIFTVNYYGAYIDTDGLTLPSSVYGEPIVSDTKGMLTVSKVHVLGTDEWNTSLFGYDNKGRVVYTSDRNDYLNTTTIVESGLDFVGKVKKNRIQHRKDSGAWVVTIDNYSYDHRGRLMNHYQCIGEGSGFNDCDDTADFTSKTYNSSLSETTIKTASESFVLKPGFHFMGGNGKTLHLSIAQKGELIVHNGYDALGQLVQKKLGNSTSIPLQTINYTYNVRGWLKTINDVDNLGSDLFGFELGYENPRSGATKLFNGNISETYWRTKSDNTLRRYAYSYDALNRITGAVDNTTNYSLSGITYDQNGNITKLLRKGHTNESATTFGDMDNLTYGYDSGNKLLSVTDAVATPTLMKGEFKDGNKTGNDYNYDDNGNLIQDLNKGIPAGGITYNHLNLPTSIDIGTGNISYIYDATGTKLRKIVSGGATTDYSGNYIYENGDLQFFSHPEGYVNTEGAGYEYVYQYKDHLGNIRLSYTDDLSNTGTPTIIEENNYYPFGLKHKGYNHGTSSLGNSVAQRWKYNGKEYDESLDINTYDFGARNYNPAIGRWMNVDPMTESMPAWSSYNFSFNNPVRYKDPDGRAPFDWVKQADNTVVYDSRVTDQASAEAYYGKGSTHIKNGTNVTTVSGKEITLGAGGYWASGGQVKRASDRAPSVYANKLDGSDGVTAASAFTAAAKEVQYSKLFQSWRGNNGKMYNGLKGRGPNQYTGSRGNAKAKAGRIGMGGTALGILSIGMTEYDYQQSLDINYGPNMRRHLDRTYGMDQSFNVSGFGGVWGAAASFGYNLGYMIEGACNCNIQYNPYTGDFTPIEQTYMKYDRLGIDLSDD